MAGTAKTYFLLLQFGISTYRRQNWTRMMFTRLNAFAFWFHFQGGYFEAFGCSLLSRWISFPDCMGFMISFPSRVDFKTAQVGFVFHAFCISACALLFSASSSVRISVDNCKLWTLQCSLFFGHDGICLSLSFIVVTEPSAQTISGMNAVSNINLSSRYVLRDV